jgi:nickel-dependent lactate racemase
VNFTIPDRTFAGLVKTRDLTGEDIAGGLKRALDEPVSEPLESLSRGRDLCVLIEDDTRAEPHDEIIQALAARIREASSATFIVTTGSHDPGTRGNIRIMESIRSASRDTGLNLKGVHVNNCFSDDFVEVGTTSRGTRLMLNPAAIGADLYVVGADMKNHYFAGYSNALKDFLPGICAYESIEGNHSWALDPRSTFGVHPFHPDPSRRDNPLAIDMLEAQEMITGDAPVFALATVSSHEKLLWACAGDMRSVTTEGIRAVDESSSFTVKRTSHAIVSPGGYPQDESLYHAQRGLELTKNAINDGGSVLLLAQCENGLAPNQKARENFYDRLTRPLDEVLDSISQEYELYSHKAYKFAEMMRRLRAIHIHSGLEVDIVEGAHFLGADDPQLVIDGWLEEDPGARIRVFDDANKIAVYGV